MEALLSVAIVSPLSSVVTLVSGRACSDSAYETAVDSERVYSMVGKCIMASEWELKEGQRAGTYEAHPREAGRNSSQ